MAPDIQLGYLVCESDRPSTASCSEDSHPVEMQEQRTRDWVTRLPADLGVPSNKVGTEKVGDKKRVNDWHTLPPEILRGPAARFRSLVGRWLPVQQYGLRSNLLISVGFLELANACDFPANIWNEIPVPLFAAILMGIGGTIALALMYCAAKDMRLSSKNLRLLRTERARLKGQLRSSSVESGSQNYKRSIQACLAVNTREFGFELLDRFVMDLTMGIGCLLVGVGTLMAIGGNNPKVFLASNLLSGYIGNTPAALYGVINAIWSSYIWLKADTNSRASCHDVAVALIWPQLSHRHDTIKLHAIVYGLTSLVAGAGSLMTATLWYGYVMLVPCVLASAWCNWLWRNRCGYGRPILTEAPILSRDCLIAEIQAIGLLQRTIKQKQKQDRSVFGIENLPYHLEVVQRYDLMTEFCLVLYKNAELRDVLFGEATTEEKSIDVQDLLNLDAQKKAEVMRLLTEFVLCEGDKNLMIKALRHRERYLLELLGSWFYYLDQNSTSS